MFSRRYWPGEARRAVTAPSKGARRVASLSRFCGQLHLGAKGLDVGELGPQVVPGRLVGSLAGAESLFELDEALLRDVARLDEAGGVLELEARIFHLGHGLADGGGALRRDLLLAGVEPDARKRLCEGGAGALVLEVELPLVELGEDVAFPDALAEIHENFRDAAGDFRTYRDCLIGQQRTCYGDGTVQRPGFGNGNAHGDGRRGLCLLRGLDLGLPFLRAAERQKSQK